MITIKNDVVKKLKIFNKGFNKNVLEDLKILIREIKSFENKETNDDYNKYANELKERISLMYSTSPHILKSEIVDEFFIQDDIKYLIKHLKVDELSKKPISIGTRKNENKSYFDPFEPPFIDGQVIEESFGNFNTHRIFFSKFAVMKEHMLLVTRDFYSQYTHLNYDDIRNSILLMKVMNGVIFFNGGENSGASQLRKHLQCIPYSSMYEKDFGIFQLINNQENLEIIYDEIFVTFNKIKQFTDVGINHLLIKFNDEFKNKLENDLNNETIELYTRFILFVYNIGLVELDLLENEEELTKHYSFLLTTEWMLIIPRKTAVVKLENGELNINSIGYLLTVLVKNENLITEIKNRNLLVDIFSKL